MHKIDADLRKARQIRMVIGHDDSHEGIEACPVCCAEIDTLGDEDEFDACITHYEALVAPKELAK